MAATIIDGREVSARVRAEVAREVSAFSQEGGRPPEVRPGPVVVVAGRGRDGEQHRPSESGVERHRSPNRAGEFTRTLFGSS